MKRGDFIVIIEPRNVTHTWPYTGIIIDEHHLPSYLLPERFPEPDPFTFDILWDDGVITRGVDGWWLARHYFVP
jgi:hypothetical protein